MARKPARRPEEPSNRPTLALTPPVSSASLAPRRKPGPKPGTEAARRGGAAVRRKYGSEHFRQIGAKGGSVAKQRRGLDFYREIGQRGGKATRREHGREHYARIGSMGGQRPRQSSTSRQPSTPGTPTMDQPLGAAPSED